MGNAQKLTQFASAFAILVGLGSVDAAQAADLLLEPQVIEAPEVPIVEHRSGWYLRADVTYDWKELRGLHDNNFAMPYANAEVDDTWDLGIGIGYQVTDYFRADLTAEYQFETDIHGSNSITDKGLCDKDHAVSETCTYTDKTRVSTFKLMANGYADFGHFAGLTPYVGAGIGGAYVSYEDYQHTHINQPHIGGGGCGLCGQTTNISNRNGEDSWRFAWALHTGAAYKISHNLKLDVGYTYSRIEGGVMDYDASTGLYNHDKGFNDHIIHAGLRYNLW